MTAPPPRVDAALARARSLVVLTGAGMSAESGVPTFRGPGGLWEGIPPESLATPEAFEDDPARVWRWYRWRGERVAAAEPHRGHRALVEAERSDGFDRVTVVTQNVDRLHQRAGSRQVIELHGTLVQAHCSCCGRRTAAASVDPDRCDCPCGRGRFRPSVVWFGEPLPLPALASARSAVDEADMVWVVGTSSVVYPAAAIPERAAARGLVIVEVNPDATPLTPRVDWGLRAPASEGLTYLLNRRRELRSSRRTDSL